MQFVSKKTAMDIAGLPCHGSETDFSPSQLFNCTLKGRSPTTSDGGYEIPLITQCRSALLLQFCLMQIDDCLMLLKCCLENVFQSQIWIGRNKNFGDLLFNGIVSEYCLFMKVFGGQPIAEKKSRAWFLVGFRCVTEVRKDVVAIHICIVPYYWGIKMLEIWPRQINLLSLR